MFSAYFIGTIWIIFCQLENNHPDWFDDSTATEDEHQIKWNALKSNGKSDPETVNLKYSNFYDEYDIESLKDGKKELVGMYYAFTTLSTVGFGDYNPKSNIERLLVIIMMCFGMTFFSQMIGKFSELYEQYQGIDAEHSEDEELEKFIGLINHFNDGKKN